MPRIEDGIGVEEGLASDAICGLAESIQTLCYGLDSQGVPPLTVKALHRAFRVLQPIVTWYLGDNSPLVWDGPPDYKFKPKAKDN